MERQAWGQAARGWCWCPVVRERTAAPSVSLPPCRAAHLSAGTARWADWAERSQTSRVNFLFANTTELNGHIVSMLTGTKYTYRYTCSQPSHRNESGVVYDTMGLAIVYRTNKTSLCSWTLTLWGSHLGQLQFGVFLPSWLYLQRFKRQKCTSKLEVSASYELLYKFNFRAKTLTRKMFYKSKTCTPKPIPYLNFTQLNILYSTLLNITLR